MAQTIPKTINVIPSPARMFVTIAADANDEIALATEVSDISEKNLGANTSAHFVTRIALEAIVKQVVTTVAISLYFWLRVSISFAKMSYCLPAAMLRIASFVSPTS